MNDKEITMEIHTPTKKVFMAKFDRFEPVNQDHTAIIAAKQCARKYFYQIVLGRTPKEEMVYFAWGTSYHRFRQVLENEYGLGDNMPKKFDEAKAILAYSRGTLAGIQYWKNKGKDQDITSKFSWMTEARLKLSFHKAYEYWKQEKLQNRIHVIATEQPFNIQLPDGTNRSGTADQIVKWNGDIWGRDFKTTSKDTTFYERTLDPNDQFTGYTYCEAALAGVPKIRGQLVELLFNAKSTKKEDKGPEIIPLIANRTQWQLDDWLRGHTMITKMVNMWRDEDNYPMSEVSCPFCPYHRVCTSSSEASAMYELESNYNLRPWDHSKVGQD